MTSDHRVLERFRAVDHNDVDGFIDMLTDDHQFVFGARPPMIDKAEARAVVPHFCSMFGGLRHNLRRLTDIDEVICIEADVDCDRLDDKLLTDLVGGNQSWVDGLGGLSIR